MLIKLGYHKGSHTPSSDQWVSAESKSAGYPAALTHPSMAQMGNIEFSLNGIPVKAHPRSSNKSLETLRREFENRWRSKGYTVQQQALGGMNVLSAVNEQAGVCETEITLPLPGQNQTLVIPARFDLKNLSRPGNPRASLYPGAQSLYHIESRDPNGQTENLLLSTTDDASRVTGYYRERLAQEGWLLSNQLPAVGSGAADVLLFLKGQQEQWISVSVGDDGRTLVFLMHNSRK